VPSTQLGVSFEGPISTAIETMRGMIASSAAFQAWTGTASPSAATQRVHLFAVGEADIETRPWALVSLPAGGFEMRRVAGGAASFFATLGRLQVDFESGIAGGDTPALAEEEFVDDVEAILDEVLALAGVGANLPLEDVERVGGPSRADRDEAAVVGDYYRLQYELPWGVNA